MQELFKKLRKYEIKIRKAVNSHQQGEFRSLFKGTGLEFDDVRQYQYGDDIRAIDWNVTAKGHGAFIKTFKEERDQSIFFLVDISGSQDIGSNKHRKIDLTKEVASVLALAGSNLGSQVGLVCFSDQKEKYIKPNKGSSHAYQLIQNLYKLSPTSRKTDIKKGLTESFGLIKRKSIIVLISDFLDNGFDSEIKALANKHDLIIIHIHDKIESRQPSLGIIPVADTETGAKSWRNTSFFSFSKKRSAAIANKSAHMQELCKKHQIDYLNLRTDQEYVNPLIQLFKLRNSRWKRG